MGSTVTARPARTFWGDAGPRHLGVELQVVFGFGFQKDGFRARGWFFG